MILETITWNANPEIFRIGSIAIRWYGLFFALSFYLGYIIMEGIFKKEDVPLNVLDSLATYMIIATVIGARLGHVLFYQPEYYFAHLIEILKIWEGGLASHGAAVGIIITILVTFIILAATSNLIRIADDNSPFSLALTQLAFWSIVIASSFSYIWIVTDALPPITGSTLVLLSVSALTTAGAKLVDIRAGSNNQLARSISFLEDILQDEIGYSVHRAQMFMWTVIMVIIFVTNVIRFQQIPQLDESLLALMGISSGTYVGLKTMENKKDAPAATL